MECSPSDNETVIRIPVNGQVLITNVAYQGTEVCATSSHSDKNTVITDFGSGYIVPLSFVSLEIESNGLKSIPIKLKTLRDSGSMINIVRKASIASDAYVSQGPIKLQGVFGQPIEAELITLNVRLSDSNESSPFIPVTFAVTDELKQDYDAIMPEAMVDSLQKYSCMSVNSVEEDNNDKVKRTTSVEEKDENKLEELVGSTNSPPLKVINQGQLNGLIKDQKEDESLEPYWQLAKVKKGNMMVRDGALYHRDTVCGMKVEQLAVPVG
jgi:hypothetical protein